MGKRGSKWEAIALTLSCPELEARHRELKSMGFKHSYSDFKCHMSIVYKPKVSDIDLVNLLFKLGNIRKNYTSVMKNGNQLRNNRMLIQKTKQFKENVRYVLRDNAPDDIMTYVRKYFDIPSHITRFSFVAGKTIGNFTRDQFGNNVVRADSRCYFKADKENTQEVPCLEEFELKPRFEENVWYELRSDAVSHFKFTRDIMLTLGIVSDSVFRFMPDRVDSSGNAIVGREKIPASDVAMFNRELDIQVGKNIKSGNLMWVLRGVYYQNEHEPYCLMTVGVY